MFLAAYCYLLLLTILILTVKARTSTENVMLDLLQVTNVNHTYANVTSYNLLKYFILS